MCKRCTRAQRQTAWLRSQAKRRQRLIYRISRGITGLYELADGVATVAMIRKDVKALMRSGRIREVEKEDFRLVKGE